MSWSRAWNLLNDPAPPWWAGSVAWSAVAALVLVVFLKGPAHGMPTSIAWRGLTVWFLVMVPVLVAAMLLRTRELRRCQYATNRWFAGLCPVCKYPRDDDADDICPECGRDMPEQARLAARRMGRTLDDLRDSSGRHTTLSAVTDRRRA